MIDGRDSLGCDPEETDPLYKLTPFYLTFNKASNFWHGIYYNTLNPSIFDFGAEHDFSTGKGDQDGFTLFFTLLTFSFLRF